MPAVLRRIAADRSYAPTARAAAVAGLAQVPLEPLESSRFLVSFLDEPSFHLRQATVNALVRFADPQARRALSAYYPRARTAPERRAIESLPPDGGR